MTELNPSATLLGRVRPALASSGVLREPNYRLYIILQVISLAGSMLVSVVQGYIVADLTHGSAIQVGIIWMCSIGPMALLSPFVGHLIDGWDKRTVLQITSALAVIQTCILGHLINTHQATVLRMDFLALMLGFITVIDGTARQVIIPLTIVNLGFIKSGAALFTCLYSLGQVGGPMFAGSFVAMFHNYGSMFYLNAISYLPLIFFLRLVTLIKHDMPNSAGQPAAKRNALTSFTEGAGYVFRHKKIRTLLFLSGVLCIFNFLPLALLSVASMEMFKAKDIAICGYLSAAFGLGGGCGSILIFLLSANLPFRKCLAGGAIVGGLGLFNFALSTHLGPALVLIFLAGAGSMSGFSTVRSTILDMSHRSNSAKNAAVMSFVMSFMGLGIIIGLVGGGLLARLVGCPITFGFFGLMLIVLGLASLRLHPEVSVHVE